MVLQAVISQQLVPSIDEKMIPVFEIMTVTPAIRNMIRDNKIPQLEGIISSSAGGEIISMDSSLLTLYKEGQITAETALAYATNPEMLKRKMSVVHDHPLSRRAFGTMLTTNTLKKVHRTFLSYAWQQKNEDISDCTTKLISSFFYFISAILFSGFLLSLFFTFLVGWISYSSSWIASIVL